MRRKGDSQEHILAQAVILTAQPVVFTELCAYLTDQREEIHDEGTIYQVGTFSDPRGNWRVAVAETGTGNNSAAMETERAIHQYRPSVTLFVGLAGGLKDLSVGDVVASTKLYGYESGK